MSHLKKEGQSDDIIEFWSVMSNKRGIIDKWHNNKELRIKWN